MKSIFLINDDCRTVLPDIIKNTKNPVIVSDPPFNIGYKYRKYKDRIPENEYYSMLKDIFGEGASVIVHYPEIICRLSIEFGKSPERIVSWVYNSNTARQHRDIAFWEIKPDFRRVTQPYKNLNDKRIKARIAAGKTGCKLYDWWDVNQVKNVNKEKTSHPCQMPVKVMENILGILPDDITVIDPFMGSGTTGIAAQNLGIDFIGIEIDPVYFGEAKERLQNNKNLMANGG